MPKCPYKEKCVAEASYPQCSCTFTSKIDRESLIYIDDSHLRRALQTYREVKGDEQT